MGTNFERFMDMSVDELAEMLSGFCKLSDGCNRCPLLGECPYNETGCYPYDPEDWVAWLRKEEKYG